MSRFAALLLLCSLWAFAEEGFRPLFNGRSLDGWDWNEYEISCDGDHIQLKLNGVQTADLHDSMKKSGIIALQLHSGPPMEAYFRNIRIGELK